MREVRKSTGTNRLTITAALEANLAVEHDDDLVFAVVAVKGRAESLRSVGFNYDH